MTALAGVIPFQIGGLKSNIEVVRRIPGVSGSVDALAVQTEWNGKTIRVLDPISLLACKLELVERCTSPKIRRLLAICYYLQILASNSPFFLGVSDAAKITGFKSKRMAAVMLNGLVRDDVLRVAEKGKPGVRRATRFRYNFAPSSVP
jgi:hypothetical protein